MPLKGHTPSFLNDTESIVEKETVMAVTMQDVHVLVRTITKGNFFGEGGEIPMAEFENQLRNDWLAKGWKIVGFTPIGRSDDAFELAVMLVKDVVL